MRSGSPAPFQSTVASVLLDAVRGVAALLVCAGHWRYLFFVNYPQLHLHRSLFFLPYVICTTGHQAVVVFFVLSGYLVGGHILPALETGTWSWGTYLLHRGVRLWIVLLPALALGGLVDLTAIHLHLAPALYAGLVDNHVTVNVNDTLTWRALLGNCLFLQTILIPIFGSNTPLWSLANEFWYYLIFPLGLLAVRGPYAIVQRIAMGIACLGAAYFVGPGIRSGLWIWLLGVLLALLPVWRTTPWMRWLALALYCPFFAAVTRTNVVGRLQPDYALGLATFVLMYVLLGARQPATGAWYEQPSRTLARFSYTLYLVHFPILIILTALLAGETQWVPTAPHLAIGLTALLFVIGVAYLLAKGTEFRTVQFRNWLSRLPRNAHNRHGSAVV